MFPVYRGMNSYPYQMGQSPSTQHCYPSWELPPPPMKEVSGSSSHVQQPWPHNYGFPAPMPFQNCCAHGQSFYNFRPPCPHFLPQPVYGHCCGGYPAYPQPYSVNYVPSTHYATEIPPRYEYDKDAPKEFHCCGCPNHSCHVNGKNNVKIEEHEPEAETVKNEFLVPSAVNNIPYPIVWIPPGYALNKEQPRRAVEHESDDRQVTPYVRKHQVQPKHPLQPEVRERHGSPRTNKPTQSMPAAEPDSNVGYGWFPLDMNSFRKLMEGATESKANDLEKKSEDEKKGQVLEKKDQNKQFTCPIIWMPYDAQGQPILRGSEERKDDSPPAAPPSSFKVEPMKAEHPDNQAEVGKAEAGDNSNAACAAVNRENERTRKLRTIPVKQLEEKTKEHVENMEKTSQECNKNGSSSQSSSPTRKSKLPPICLRVDPPKKKNGNGSSRSPSPPGGRKHQASDHSIVGGNSRELHSHMKEMKSEKAVDNVPNEAKEKKETATRAEEQVEASANVRRADDKMHASESQEQESIPQEPSRPVRKIMSEAEAATAIQSAYRGYDVRRWEPLKKLRQIAKVREEATEVKRHIEDLESRAAINDKEKVAISETIMRLLLSLDAIQGLHSSIRDVRRSVAKDLTILQENLDSALSRKAVPIVDDSPTIGVEEPPRAFGLENCSEESPEPSGVSSLDEALESSKGAESHREGEGAQSDEVSLSEPPVSQNVVDAPDQFIRALQNKPENEEAISAVKSTAHPVEAEQQLEMKESKVVIREMAPALDSEELLSNDRHFEDTEAQPHMLAGDEDHPHEVVKEQIENDISRMDWECDLGTVRVTGDVVEEVAPLAELPQEISAPQVLASESGAPPGEGEQHLEMEESEVVIMEMAPADCSESQEPLSNDKQVEDTGAQPHMVSGDEDHPHEVVEEQIENDISRMVWECDLGTVRVTGEMDEKVALLAELPPEIIKQQVENEVSRVDRVCDIETPMSIVSSEEHNVNADSGSEVEKVSLKHVAQPSETESSGPLNEGQEKVALKHVAQPSETESSGPLNEGQEMDLPIDKPDVGCDFDLPIDKPDVGCDFFVTEREGHVPVEVSNEILSGLDWESTYSPKGTEIHILGQRDQELQEPLDEVAFLVDPVIKVETVTEDLPKENDNKEGLETSDLASNASSESHEDFKSINQATCESLAGVHTKAEEFQAASDHVKQEVDAVPEMTHNVQLYNDDDEASTLSSEGQASVVASENGEQIDKKTIEENQKLRDMLEKLLASGKEQQDVISSLTAKIRDMEKKLAKKGTKKSANRSKVVITRSCRKSSNGSVRQRPMGIAS